MSSDEQSPPTGHDDDADKLAEPAFPSGVIPREEGEQEMTTDESRAKAKDPEHGGE